MGEWEWGIRVFRHIHIRVTSVVTRNNRIIRVIWITIWGFTII